MKHAIQVRRRFYGALLVALRVVWPVFSILLGAMLGLGLGVAYLEGWSLGDGIYFAFVTGLTVGYGDLVPHQSLARFMAICIGFTGVLLTALFAAVSVRALQEAVLEPSQRQGQSQAEQAQ